MPTLKNDFSLLPHDIIALMLSSHFVLAPYYVFFKPWAQELLHQRRTAYIVGTGMNAPEANLTCSVYTCSIIQSMHAREPVRCMVLFFLTRFTKLVCNNVFLSN